jgi:hypothetical protein
VREKKLEKRPPGRFAVAFQAPVQTILGLHRRFSLGPWRERGRGSPRDHICMWPKHICFARHAGPTTSPTIYLFFLEPCGAGLLHVGRNRGTSGLLRAATLLLFSSFSFSIILFFLFSSVLYFSFSIVFSTGVSLPFSLLLFFFIPFCFHFPFIVLLFCSIFYLLFYFSTSFSSLLLIYLFILIPSTFIFREYVPYFLLYIFILFYSEHFSFVLMIFSAYLS